MAETHTIPHEDIVAQCLTALGCDIGGPLQFDVLAAGASGAYVYRLRGASEDRILKVTRPGSVGYARVQAHREVRFYEHLARQVRLDVPRMLASCRNDSIGACLLLDAYQTTPEPAAWTDAMFAQVAELLGRFHATFWGKAGDLSAFRWLRRVDEVGTADIRRAVGHWDRLRGGRGAAKVLTPERYQRIIGMLEPVCRASSDTSSLPHTLCHGDFHIGNILIDGGDRMLVADWQEVGLGRGPEDLSFLIQRASFAGGRVPSDAMIDVYRRSLTTHLAVDVAEPDIRRVMEMAELRTRLLHWPAFLANSSEHQVMTLIDRIETLGDRLGIATASAEVE